LQQKPEFTFSSKDLVRRARISMRQMQWWTEHGYLPCGMRGHSRTFTERDVLQAALMRELKVKGVTLAKMRRVSSVLALNAGNRYLITDGRRMVVWSNDEMHIIRAAKESKFPVVVIDVLALRHQAGLIGAEAQAA